MAMSSGGSVTHWIGRLKAGDSAAAQHLWERYFQSLVGLARKKLQGTPRQVADEEDVALSAFASFCRRAEQGQFPQLLDRDDLWQLLVLITARKALNQMRHERRQKRGGALAHQGVLPETAIPAEEPDLDQIISPEPTPEFAAQFAEECRRLFNILGEAELRSIAQWKMEGDTTEEIAVKLGRAPRTIERKLRLIRSLWTKELPPTSEPK
jgi:DNA-directed RNA polymerase specialized sigma24 family protein